MISPVLICVLLIDSEVRERDDLEKLVENYERTFSSMINNHALIKNKKIMARLQVPWYTEEIATAKRQRRKAERI